MAEPVGMCGINGFNWNDERLIAAMNHATRHRGPDDTGVYVDDAVSLGHCRLAIIDLSARGHQPMSNEDGTIWCVYNGEVYNFQEIRPELAAAGHSFRSLTDTEVVIHAYESEGLECLNRFNGMWAFALYDRSRRRLVLARDRFGIKPLYYHVDGGRLIFSSMIAGILAHPVRRAPDDGAVMEFLAYNLEQHDGRTFFESIHSLEPGCLLIFDLWTRRHRVERWYTPAVRPRADEAALREAFTQSVRLRTVSDVPIGVCLSGGIDSTAITCTLDDHLAQPFNTYSLVAPGSPVDERRYIEEVARHTRIGTLFTTVRAEDFLEDIDDFVEAMEEPVTGLSAYAQYQVFKLAHAHGAKVLLDGQGGDEILAGYVYYFGYLFYELLVGLEWPALVKEMIQSYRKLGDPFPHALLAFLLAPRGLRHRLWKKRICPWVDHDFLERACGGRQDPRWERMTVRQSLRQTLGSTSIPHNLMWEDKSSMRWSIESRTPFLDVGFVETAMALDTRDLLRNGETKVIFKRAMSSLLPEMIRNRKDKVGFEAPVDELFRDRRVVRLTRDVLASRDFAQRPYWRGDRVRAIFDKYVAGKANAGETIWKCLNTELWLRRFFAAPASA